MKDLIQKKIRKGSKASKKTYALFESAFPPIEKLSYRDFFRYGKRGKTDFFAYYDGEIYVGFAFVMLTKKYAYLLFCATEKELRSQGYGTSIIEKLKEYYSGRKMVLDIEPLDETAENARQREKRLAFYENNGFKQAKYYMEDATGKYVILTTDTEFDLEDFKTSFEIYPPMFDGTIVKEY